MPSICRPPEPWNSFLIELESAVDTDVRLDCIGGFVLTQIFGLDQTTRDVDVIEIAPSSVAVLLMKLGQQGGELHRKYGIYLDFVGVAAVPDEYEERMVEMFPGAYERLRLMALDPYDLMLSKLHRNHQKDRDDVRFLAASLDLDLEILKQRYRDEMRFHVGVPAREDRTLKLWVEMIEEDRATAQP